MLINIDQPFINNNAVYSGLTYSLCRKNIPQLN